MTKVTVRCLSAGDEQAVLEAAHLFGDPPDPAAVRALLASPTDHLLLAYADGRPAGFALAHQLRRLDGQPELFLQQLGTDPAFLRRGVAWALIGALKDIGRRVHASTLFALTPAANRPALALYRATGGRSAGEGTGGIVMVAYALEVGSGK